MSEFVDLLMVRGFVLCLREDTYRHTRQPALDRVCAARLRTSGLFMPMAQRVFLGELRITQGSKRLEFWEHLRELQFTRHTARLTAYSTLR